MIVVEYGSKKRGDDDITSDSDVLLLGDDWTEVEGLHTKFEAAGCSVSFFSTDRVKYLLSEGSLFFKHIIDEGQVVLGRTDDFLSLASAWKPANSYNAEVESTVDLLELLSWVPSCRRGVAIATDLLVNCLRSILIRRLAERGSYIFSWSAVIREASHRCLLPLGAERVVLHGRRLKNEYRRYGRTNMELTLVEQLSELICTAVGRSRVVPRICFSNRAEIKKLPESLHDYSYKQLRAWEFLCAEYPHDPSLTEFERWTKQPNYFRSISKSRSLRTHNLFY